MISDLFIFFPIIRGETNQLAGKKGNRYFMFYVHVGSTKMNITLSNICFYTILLICKNVDASDISEIYAKMYITRLSKDSALLTVGIMFLPFLHESINFKIS